MPDLSLDILIKMLSDRRGAAEVTDDLKGIRAATEGAGEASKDASKAMREHGEEAEKAEPWFEKLGISHRALHQLLHLIGHESGPAAGAALAGLAAVTGGGLLIGIMAAKEAFEYFKKSMEESTKAAEEAAKQAADPTFAEGIKAHQKVLEDASKAAMEYSQHLNDLLANQQSITAELKAQLDLQHQIDAARESAVKAQQEARLALVREQLAAGRITPEQAAQREADIKLRGIQEEADAKKAADAGDLKAKGDSLALLERQKPVLEANAHQVRDQVTQEAARRATTAADFGDAAYDKQKKELELPERVKAEENLNEKISNLTALENQARMNEAAAASSGNTAAAKEYASQANSLAAQLAPLLDAMKVMRQPEEALHSGREQYLRDKATQLQFDQMEAAAKAEEKAATDNASAIDALTNEVKALTAKIAGTASFNATDTQQKKSAAQLDYEATLQKDVAGTEAGNKSAYDSNSIQAMQAQLAASQQKAQALYALAQEALRTHSDTYGPLEDVLNTLTQQNKALWARIGQLGQ